MFEQVYKEKAKRKFLIHSRKYVKMHAKIMKYRVVEEGFNVHNREYIVDCNFPKIYHDVVDKIQEVITYF